MSPLDLLWLFLIFSSLQPLVQKQLLAATRRQGTWTHDHLLMASDLERLGLPVRVGVPPEGRALMKLYPQPRSREAAVEYVPGRPVPGLPPGRETPRRPREAESSAGR
jgi:hypothetical protein